MAVIFGGAIVGLAPLSAGEKSRGPAAPLPQPYGPFDLPTRLMPRVLFWVEIYASTYGWERLIHDTRYPQLTYKKIDIRNKGKDFISQERAKILQQLRRLSLRNAQIQSGKRPGPLLKEDEPIWDLFARQELLHQLAGAADLSRIRAQGGLKDSLEDALFVSGRYLPRMKTLFERFELPIEIAYLPFVESGFNKQAVSKVGASGIWQFMPYTGKLFLRVDDVVDERNDPMRAAEAAARYMKQNHENLKVWPLAITAYNHGAAGVARGVREVGSTELVDLIDRYESRSFGFASQNFYASFMAAIHVTKHADFYLGHVPRAKKLEFDEFVMPHYMEMSIFLQRMQLDEVRFRELNPALTEKVFSGAKYLPVGYTVRVPMEDRRDFLQRYDAIPAQFKLGEQKGHEARFDEEAPPPAIPVKVTAVTKTF
jgi:membrane-bound lytic murein transglycosylase D